MDILILIIFHKKWQLPKGIEVVQNYEVLYDLYKKQSVERKLIQAGDVEKPVIQTKNYNY